MQTNLEIDDKFMAAARQQAYEDLKALRGTVCWEGNLHEMRQDRLAYDVKVNVQTTKASKPQQATRKFT